MSKEGKVNPETSQRPPYQTIENVVKQAKETLLEYHWHKPTIILEGSIKTITGNFRELLPDFSVQVQQMLEAGIEIGKAEVLGSIEQSFLITEVTVKQEGDTRQMTYKAQELLQVTHCHISSKQVITRTFLILYDDNASVTGFQDFSEEDNSLINQDIALTNALLIGYLQGRLLALR